MSISILLRCKDISETRSFYRDVLGFSVSDTAEGTLSVSNFDGTLIFTESDLWRSAPTFSGTIYFNVPDLERIYSEISGKATAAWGPERMSYGSREFAVLDCNGYYIAFREAI